MRRNVSLIIVPHDNAQPRNYKISYRLLFALLAAAAFTLVLTLIFLFSYGKVAWKAAQSLQLEKQNRELFARAAQVDSLTHELFKLQAMSIQIKKMLGVDLSPSDSILVAQLSSSAKSPAISYEEDLMESGEKEQRRALKSAPSIWPVKGYITRSFFTTGGEKSADYHPGIDIAAAESTPVIASAEGVIVTSSWDETYGNMLVIDHGFGIYTLYGHNSRNLVKVGDRVAKGQAIAFVGSSGKSSAPHLHFEVRKQGLPVNPREYLLD
jgi:murein DD-endopeptidase MepM/ murein hydrolase activator NlpD